MENRSKVSKFEIVKTELGLYVSSEVDTSLNI